MNKEITLEDLQELGGLLESGTGRPMTDLEITEFNTIPKGATKYPDYESYRAACGNVKEPYQTGCNSDEGLFWIKELL